MFITPVAYMLCDLEWDDVGEAKVDDAHLMLGLVCPVEKVAEVGVLKSPGETGRYGGHCPSDPLGCDSCDNLA